MRKPSVRGELPESVGPEGVNGLIASAHRFLDNPKVKEALGNNALRVSETLSDLRRRAENLLLSLDQTGRHLLKIQEEDNTRVDGLFGITTVCERLGIFAKGKEFMTKRRAVFKDAPFLWFPDENDPSGITNAIGNIQVHFALPTLALLHQRDMDKGTNMHVGSTDAIHFGVSFPEADKESVGKGWTCGMTDEDIHELYLRDHLIKRGSDMSTPVERLSPRVRRKLQNQVLGFTWRHTAEAEYGRRMAKSLPRRIRSTLPDSWHLFSLTAENPGSSHPPFFFHSPDTVVVPPLTKDFTLLLHLESEDTIRHAIQQSIDVISDLILAQTKSVTS